MCVFASAGRAGDDDVVAPLDEGEIAELDDESLVEPGLEMPVEGLERLALDEAASLDAVLDAMLSLVGNLAAEDVLEQSARGWTLAGGPSEQLIDALARESQSEEPEVLLESDSTQGVAVEGGMVGLG
jgi:hypothetical protein